MRSLLRTAEYSVHLLLSRDINYFMQVGLHVFDPSEHPDMTLDCKFAFACSIWDLPMVLLKLMIVVIGWFSSNGKK